MRQSDRAIEALKKGRMLSGIVNIPADKSSYKKDISIQLFAFKIADKGYQLDIEKYYSGQWDSELSRKHRRFNQIEDLQLYVTNNYSIEINDFKISSEVINKEFEDNRKGTKKNRSKK